MVMSMATVKKGTLTPPPEWWKHLRWAKRLFWKKERGAVKRLLERAKANKPSQ